MCKPSIYLLVTYFPAYLPIYETYLLQRWLRRCNQILTQLRLIHNWVIMSIQWMVRWWVLVHCDQVNRISVNIDTRYLPSSFFGVGDDKPIWLAHCSQKNEAMAAPQNRRFCFDVYGSSPSPRLYRWKENNICQAYGMKGRCLYGEHVGEPIRNLEGTHWETGQNEKKKSFPPSKLERNKSKAHWAFPLPERKTNPPLPPPPNKTCMESPCPSGHWTVHYPHQIQLEKNLASNLPPTPKFGDLLTSPIN